MKNCYLLFVLLIFVSCKAKQNIKSYQSFRNIPETLRFTMSLSQVNCNKPYEKRARKFIASTFSRRDTVIIETDLDFCTIYKEGLNKGSLVKSYISLRNSNDGIKYRSHIHRVFDEQGKIIDEESSGGTICCFGDCSFESFKKTIRYKLSEANYRIHNSTVPLDSIGSVFLFHHIERK